MFDTITDLADKLHATGYFIDPVMTQVVFLAAKLQKPLLLEGPAGSGKTYMALGTIHVLADGRPSTTLVMCPSHITHKWAREVLLTIPRARAFLIEDMRNGGDPSRPHGICEVKLSKGKTVSEGKRLSLPEMRRMGRKEWRKRFPGPTFFITGKDKGKLGYFWEHVYLKAKSGPNLGGVVNPDSGVAILDSEMQKLTALDFTDKLKVSEALTTPRGGTTRYSALWQADRSRIQRMAPIEYVGRYMRGWFDFAIADELHQLAGDTAQGNGLGVLGRAAQRLIALTGTLMGGYADDLFNIFYRMEPHAMVREGFAYGGQGRRDFQEQYGVLETIEKVEEADNACSRATKKTVRVLRKPGASPMLFGKFLMTTTAFLSLEDISDNLPAYDESVISVDMDDDLQRAYEQLEEDIRSAMKAHRGNKSLMSILLNTLLLYPDHPYDFDQIWARAFDPQTKEYVIVAHRAEIPGAGVLRPCAIGPPCSAIILFGGVSGYAPALKRCAISAYPSMAEESPETGPDPPGPSVSSELPTELARQTRYSLWRRPQVTWLYTACNLPSKLKTLWRLNAREMTIHRFRHSKPPRKTVILRPF